MGELGSRLQSVHVSRCVADSSAGLSTTTDRIDQGNLCRFTDHRACLIAHVRLINRKLADLHQLTKWQIILQHDFPNFSNTVGVQSSGRVIESAPVSMASRPGPKSNTLITGIAAKCLQEGRLTRRQSQYARLHIGGHKKKRRTVKDHEIHREERERQRRVNLPS